MYKTLYGWCESAQNVRLVFPLRQWKEPKESRNPRKRLSSLGSAPFVPSSSSSPLHRCRRPPPLPWPLFGAAEPTGSEVALGKVRGSLHFDGLEVDAGVDGVQLAVQGVEGGPLEGLGGPAVQHDAVDVLGAPRGTGQAEARRQQLENLLVALPWRTGRGRDGQVDVYTVFF